MRISWSNGYKDVEVTDDSYRLRRIMGENKVTLKFSLAEFIEFPLGAFINYQGQKYTLNSPQTINEINSTHFEYTLIFGSHQDLLENYKLKDTQGRLKFPLTATPREHLGVLVNVLNTYDSGWSIGDCITNTEKLISYNHTNCYEALQMIANEFKTEWEVVGKTIHLRKLEYNKTNPIALSYGKGNGFVSGVGRNNDDQKAGFNVLYVQGGERNIDRSKYGSKELLLPKSKEYTYEGITYVTDAKGLFITQKGVAISNRKEESLDCSHIYPQRVGTVSELIVVDAEKHFYDFKDNSIPDDLDFSQCRMNGEKITIQFNSGMLSGREFEIQQEEDSLSGYIHAERRFKLVPKEEDGYTMPNSTFKPEIGDKYAVFGMMMPKAYISDNATKTGASWEMFKEACKHFYENHESKFTFKGTLDGIWAKKDWVNIGGKIRIGGFVSFSDAEFQKQGINIRIVSVKDFINNPHSPIIELANSVQGGSIVSELDKIRENEIVREDLHKRSLDFTKRRFRDAQETVKMLEKAQLNFGKSINPVTINTMGVLVGNQASQFVFVVSKANPTEIEHNFSYNKTTKKLTTSAGVIKYISDADILTPTNARTYKFWNVAAYESAVLDVATKSYYLYIKANKTNENAIFTLSENPIKLEEVTGYYHLLVGILNSEFEEERSFVKLYGFSEYLPSQLKINRLTGQNLDINLLTGEIKGDVTFTSSSPALAQTKAISETAKQQAISTSSADATSKANIAKSQAEAKARELIDAVEIGGRNLLSNFFNETNFQRFYIIPVKSILENHIGKDIVISFEMKCSVSRAVRVYAYQTNGISIAHRKYFTVSEINKYQRFTFITKAQQLNQNPDYSSGHLAFYDLTGNQNISIRKVFIGLGNKFGGYAKSEEDIANERDEKIAQAKTESQTAWENYANLKSSNAQQSAIDRAKAFALAKDNEKETIIKSYADGKITTAEQNAINVATAKAELAETNAKAWADGKITAEEQARILADTQKLAQAEAKAKELVDAVEVGGRNYLLKSRLKSTNLIGAYSNVVDSMMGNVVKYSRPAGGGSFQFKFTLSKSLENFTNQDLIFMVIAKKRDTQADSFFQFGFWRHTYNAINSLRSKTKNLGSGWKVYWTKVNHPILGDKYQVKGINSVKGEWLFHSVGVFKSSHLVDWSPAPEDVKAEILKAKQQAITEANAKINTSKNEVAQKLGYSNFADFQNKASAGKTIIKGGIINTQLINAVAVISKYLQTELLVANKIISSNSGISVNINANNNVPFEVFNSLGTKQLELKEENGSIQFIYRNKAGHVVWHMGEEGVKYNQSTPASWKTKKLKFLSTTKSFTNSSFGITGRLASLSGDNAHIGDETYWIVEKSTNGSYFYEYVSGTSAATITHPSQHGVTYKSQNYADSNKIANGYYYLASNPNVFAAGENNDGSPLVNSGDVLNSSVKTYDKWYCITVFKYTNGKITEQFQYIF